MPEVAEPLSGLSLISASEIEAQIAVVRGDDTLPDSLKQEIVANYEAALEFLRLVTSERETAATLAATAESAAEQIREVEREIAGLRLAAPEADGGVSPGASVEDISDRLLVERTKATALRERASAVEAQIAQQEARPAEAREAQLALRADLGQLGAEVTASPPIAELTELDKSLQVRNLSFAALLDARIDRLDSEVLSHAPRLALLRAQAEAARLAVTRQEDIVRSLEELLSSTRQAAAEDLQA